MDNVAVLIPCYNEALTIKKVVEDFRKALSGMEGVNIYVYDNNSTDGTANIAKEAGAIVRYERRQGKGNVMRRMFREIDARCYIITDGDDTYPAEYALRMSAMVLDGGADMVVGDRLSSTYFTENKRRFHNFGNSFVRAGINHLFKSDIKDVMTGYRALSFRFVKTFPVLSGGFEIETEMTAHAVSSNMSVGNVVVDYRDRPEGSESKLNTISDGIKVAGTILHLFKNYRPFMFFGIIALILLIMGVGAFIPTVWIPFWRTGLVERFPTLIVCGFIIMAAIISFFSGLVLDSIRQKELREFEFRLMMVTMIAKSTM